MSSCQVTSRVVQAYIAVQIFVERCLMNLEAPAVVVDLSAGRHLEPVGVDEPLPHLGSQSRSLPLPRELADRIAAAEPHRNLSEIRAGGAPGPEHNGLSGNRSSQLHRPAGRSGAPARNRNLRRPGYRQHLRGCAHACRSAGLLLAQLRRMARGPGGRRSRSISRRTR